MEKVWKKVIRFYSILISSSIGLTNWQYDYSADEARNLKSYGEFPESVKINETVDFQETTPFYGFLIAF